MADPSDERAAIEARLEELARERERLDERKEAVLRRMAELRDERAAVNAERDRLKAMLRPRGVG